MIGRMLSRYRIESKLGEGGMGLATRKIVTVAANLGSLDAGVDATPDGRTILFTRVDSSVNDVMLVDHFP